MAPELFKPMKDVLYRIQNVEFGTFLELRHGYRDERDNPAMRPMKESKWQQWHFLTDPSNSTHAYQIVNAAAEPPSTPDILSTSESGTKVSVVEQPAFNGVAPSEVWKFYANDNDFYIVNFYRPKALVLGVDENGSLALKVERERNFRPPDLPSLPGDYRWKFVEVSPSLKDGEYRVRTLNGLGLHTKSNSKEVFISHQDDEDHRLWTFKSLGNGKCTIKNVALQKFLKLNNKNSTGVVSLTDSDADASWDIKANSEYTYMIHARHKEGDPPQDLALSLKDGKAVLRQMKIAHNRIWLIEPDEDVGASGSSNADPPDTIAVQSGNKYKLKCADGSYLAMYSRPAEFYCTTDRELAEEFTLKVVGGNNWYTLRSEDEEQFLGASTVNVEPQSTPTPWFLERAELSTPYYYINLTNDGSKVLSKGTNLADKLSITQKNNSTAKLQKWSFVP